MTPYKIVHLTSVHDAFDDRIFYKQCRSLARAGYDVTYVVPHSKDEVVDGVRIKAVPKPKRRLARMTLTVWHVYREAARQEADLYHFHDPELIPAGALLRARGKKVIYDIHEDVPRDILSKHYLPGWLRWPLGWLVERAENVVCPWFSGLIAATAAIAERFHKLNRNILVIHNYAILEEFAPKASVPWSQRQCAVTYLGTITVDRSIREIVEAMNYLPGALPATLELAGYFSPPHLSGELGHMPGWKRVNSLGFLSRAGMADVLGRVRVGLVLVYPHPNHVRAEPNKLADYMSAAIPVIASDFPLWRQVVEGADCGLLVDPKDPKAIAQAIEYLLTHPEEAEAMGRRGHEAAKLRYNWESEERKIFELYQDLLNPGVKHGEQPLLDGRTDEL